MRTAFAAPSSAEAMEGVDAIKVEYATNARLFALSFSAGRLWRRNCPSFGGKTNAEEEIAQIARIIREIIGFIWKSLCCSGRLIEYSSVACLPPLH